MTGRGILLRLVGVAALAVPPLLASPPPAAANGIGDVYVVTTADVVELHVASQRVVNTVAVPPPASSLAFSADGRTLFVASGARAVTSIDIASISVSGTLDMPAAATLVAQPQGSRVAVAFPDLRKLGFAGSDVTLSAELPGSPEILAADRRDPRAIAAANGKPWVAVVDATTGKVVTLDVGGGVVALAVDRVGSLAYAATRDPDELVAFSLETGKETWRRALPESPVAVAATAGGPVVASAKRLWKVDATASRTWRDLAAAATSATASDDGQVIVVGEGTRLEGIRIDGTRNRTIPLGSLGAARAVAAIPRPSSLLGSGVAAPSGTAAAAGSLPPTNTLGTVVEWAGSGPVPPGLVVLVLAGILIAVARWSASMEHRS